MMNFLQQVLIKFMDQYYACELDQFVGRIGTKFSVQAGLFPAFFLAISDSGPIEFTAMCAKTLANLAILLVQPNWSQFFTSYQYVAAFMMQGGFQNLGIAFILFVNFFIEFKAPMVFRRI
jgi:hypothetical protein